MNGKQLKNSILQWAIQGKLVEQNPKDEPASKLLDRIAAQKAVVNGAKKSSSVIPASEPGPRSSSKKAKSSKVPISRIYRENGSWFEQVGSAEPKDITEEIPFDIPESWEWCRLESLSLCITDGDHQPPPQSTTGVPFVVISSINGESINFEKTKFVNEEYYFQLEDSRKARNNDILFTVTGSYGKVIVVLDCPNFCFQRHIALIRPVIPPFYLKFVLSSGYIKSVCDDLATGIAQKTVGLGTLKNLLIPLPPVAEQKRIVKKLEQILPLVDEYDQAQTQLDKLNKELPESLKKSILQQAIQGKLVPQNPNDEPAQALLDRISAERVIASGAKQSKKSSAKVQNSRIYRDTDGLWYEQIGTSAPKDITEEIPFDIPENWVWCRLDTLGSFVRGNGIKRDETVPIGKPCVRYGEMYTTYKVKFSEVKSFTRDDIFERCNKIVQNDILMALTGENKWDIALAAVYQGSEELALGGDLCKFTPIESFPLYLVYLINSPYGIEYKRNTSTGDIIVHTSVGKLGNFLVPLPPLAEQKRIVAKLEELFEVL